MSARSSSSSRSRRSGPPPTYQPIGTRRPLRTCRWCVTTPRPGSAASTSCAGGLVPFWAKGLRSALPTSTPKRKASRRGPLSAKRSRRRCLVPFDCFYEWKKLGKVREPYAVGLADRRLMALAGLWETWRSPAGEGIRSFSIVTTAANDLLAPIHDRMPVILAPGELAHMARRAAGRRARIEVAARSLPGRLSPNRDSRRGLSRRTASLPGG
jgi:putative SOS response-associated peptidase YedK